MVDGSVSGLVVTAVIDAVIFTILIIVFFATRKGRSLPPDALAPVHSAILNEHDVPYIQALKNILKEPHEKKIAMIGKESWAFLQVHKIIAYVLVSFTIFGWAPLIAVYITGSTSVDSDVDQTSFKHVSDEDELLAAPMVFLFTFTVIYSVVLVLMVKRFIFHASQQPEAERPVAANILMAEGLPKNLNGPEQSLVLGQIINEKYSEASGVYIIPNYAKAQRTSMLIKELRETIAVLQEREEILGQQELVRPKLCASKVPAIPFHRNKLEKLEAKLAKNLNNGRNISSGQAFIEFTSLEAAEAALKSFSNQSWNDQRFGLSGWRLRHAPSLDELNWHNLDADMKKIRIMKVVYQIIFVVLFLIVLTPAAVLAYIGTLASVLGEWVIGFIGEYLPTIIIVVLHSIILPIVIDFLVKKEMHFTKSDEILSATFKYFIFMLFYVFIIPLLGLQFIQIISDSVTGASVNWAEIFARRLVKSSRFFTILMIHSVFFGNGFGSVALGVVIMRAIKKKRAATDTERRLIYEADPFDIAREYALSLVMVIIALTFSVVFPIMNTLALLYFSLRFIVSSYNMFYLFRRSHFQDLWKTIIWYLWQALFFFHLFTGSLFILTESTPYVVLGIIFVVLSVVILIMSIVLSFRPPKVFTVPKNLEGRNDKALADYEHPMETGMKVVATLED